LHPTLNEEREKIINQLEEQNLVQKVTYIKLGQPYRLINRVINGYLHTDGKMAIVKLKK